MSSLFYLHIKLGSILTWPSPFSCTHTPCSNGIGRTGAFITLHAQLERVKIEGVVDVFQFIKSARRQREGLVNNVVSV